jgi:hypothetical protein
MRAFTMLGIGAWQLEPVWREKFDLQQPVADNFSNWQQKTSEIMK